MSSAQDPYRPLDEPSGAGHHRRDPLWDTGQQRVFESQWDTAERRVLDLQWRAGQRRVQHVGHPRPAREGPPAAYPVMPGPAPEPPARRGRVLILPLVLLLMLVAGWQAWRLHDDNARLAAVVATEQERAATLSERTERLEKELAGVFDPESISSAVLPSVFRVRAGDFTGTAFSVGDKAGKGKSNLLTNFHVVEAVWEAGDRKVFLERGKTEVSATIVRVSRGDDLALLRADREIKGLRTAGAAVKPGQQIVVVGAPLGLEDTVTTGVVSAYRPGDTEGPSIQFDAPINPGNSGGPLLNAEGEVIGINTLIESPVQGNVGVGFAVPSNTIKQQLAGLEAGEQVEQGYLGISVQEAVGGDQQGVTIGAVAQGSGAARAGLQVGDVITAIDGTTVADYPDVAAQIGGKQPGQQVTVTIRRNGQEREVVVTLQAQAAQPAS